MRKFLFSTLLFFVACSAYGGNYYVSTAGIPGSGDGSLGNPWATLSEADLNVPDDGSTVLVMDGTYDGRVRLNTRFVNHTVFMAMNAYKAVLVNSSNTDLVISSFGGANFTLEGFEIKRPSPSATGDTLVQIQQGPPAAQDIILRNNMFHDSFNNDLLKINNICHNITVEGNIFFNQAGSDEHIDVNGVSFVTVQDNIFFNDFEGSGRPNNNDTSSFVIIKNSAQIAGESHDITVRRNVFLNYEGSNGENFVLIGEDGNPDFEARTVMVENNLLIGNSSNEMRAAFGVKGGKDIIFRSNTVVGDLPSLAYALRLNREGSNPVNDNIQFHNNIWSDPTGTMADFSDGMPAETTGEVLDNNVYFNGGNAIPTDADVLQVSDDANAVIGDPVLGSQGTVILPHWNSATGQFPSGNDTIRDEFLRLVSLYGVPGGGSVALDGADPANTPVDDILGNARDVSPDIGAYDTDGGVLILVNPASLPDGFAGNAYNQTITATGGAAPYTFAITSGSLPAGLTLSSAGILSGTPTTGGSSNFTITATDNNADTGSRAYTIVVASCIFCDEFDDGIIDSNWTYTQQVWTEDGNNLVAAATNKKAIALATPVFGGCSSCTIETKMQTAGGGGSKVWLLGWYQSKKNMVEVLMKQQSGRWIMKQHFPGKLRKAKAVATILPNTSYDVKVTFNGSALQLFVDGVSLITLPTTNAPNGTVGFQAKKRTATFDFIRVY